MMKKLLIVLIEIILMVLVVYAVISIFDSVALSEELMEVYVLCQPDDFVNVRMNPSRKSQVVGYAECSDKILTDGKQKNGFLKCYGIGENGEGWIYSGYIVMDEPVKVNQQGVSVSKGKLAARKCIGGKVRKWLHNLDTFTVYWLSEEWCVTSKGFIKTKFIELEGH